ncbi:MAG: AraC family ligand binding domain-containing protein, partial [Clostridia bacterium]|nr:AraC family ligand binding domain-containing protein [Clostridia bacterium]
MGYVPQLQHSMTPFFGCTVDFKHAVTVVGEVEPNEEMHIHDHCEIYVNVSGSGTFMVENSFYPVTRGDMILTAPNEMH